MFNISVNDKKNIYRSKPVMNVDTVPKPLTYDYMPEGYPSKSVGTVTLMEEQEVAFSDKGGGRFVAISPVILDVKLGDNLTVVWDGVSYNVTVKAPGVGPHGALAFGNLGLIVGGDTEDYPFVYMMASSNAQWGTADTAATHTIKVMRQQETYTTMDANFIPKNLNVVFSGINSSIPTSCNVTYDELRGWIENGVPVFAIYKAKDNDGSVLGVTNILGSDINTDSLSVYYQDSFGEERFVYNSDGTFSEFQGT